MVAPVPDSPPLAPKTAASQGLFLIVPPLACAAGPSHSLFPGDPTHPCPPPPPPTPARPPLPQPPLRPPSSNAPPPTGSADPGQSERGARGCDCGRQDRGSSPAGLGPVPLGGSGRRLLVAGRGEWRSGAESDAGAGGELSGVVAGTKRHRAGHLAMPSPVEIQRSEGHLDQATSLARRRHAAPQAARVRRRAFRATTPAPITAITQVDGSGTIDSRPLAGSNTRY